MWDYELLLLVCIKSVLVYSQFPPEGYEVAPDLHCSNSIETLRQYSDAVNACNGNPSCKSISVVVKYDPPCTESSFTSPNAYFQLCKTVKEGKPHCSLRKSATIQTTPTPEPVNCVWNEWYVPQCSKSCGSGQRQKTRTKSIVESKGGTCNGDAAKTEVCNEGECTTRTLASKATTTLPTESTTTIPNEAATSKMILSPSDQTTNDESDTTSNSSVHVPTKTATSVTNSDSTAENENPVKEPQLDPNTPDGSDDTTLFGGIGGGIAVAVLLVGVALLLVLRKRNKEDDDDGANEDDDPDNYDSIYPEMDQIRQEPNEQYVVEQSQNPYYGGADVGEGIIQKSENLYYGGVEVNGGTMKKEQNPYYDGDPTENSKAPHPIHTKDNPYYDDGSGQYQDTDPDYSAETKIKAGKVESVTMNENPYYSKQ